MNSNNIEKFVEPLEKYGNQVQKRKRDSNMASKKDTLSLLNMAQPQMKKRQPQSIFRPWCDMATTQKTSQVAATSKKDIGSSISKVPSIQAPVMLSPYHMAVQQQQHQTAMAMQQAMYQRQHLMAHLWARQQNLHQHQQQQQMMMQYHHQHNQRQQMFVFGQQQGQK